MEMNSAGIAEMNEGTELRSLWDLYSLHHNGKRRSLSHSPIFDADQYEKFKLSASFYEKCRKIQNGAAHLANAGFDDAVYRVQEFDKLRRRRARVDRGVSNYLVKHLKKTRMNGNRDDDRSSFCGSASTSAEMSIDKLELAALSLQGQSIFSRTFERAVFPGNSNEIQGINMQMNAKLFVDQVFLARKYIHEAGMSSKLHSLKSAHRDHLGHLEESICDAKLIKSSLQESLPNIASVIVEDEGPSHGGSRRKRSSREQSGKAIKSKEKAVFLKPVDKSFAGVNCYCSSFNSKIFERSLDTKSSHISLRKMQKIVKHAFEGTARDFKLFSGSCSSDGLSESSRYSKVNIRDSCTSSTKRECPQMKKAKRSHGRGSSITQASGKENASSLLNKHHHDIHFEAKRQISLQWNRRQYEERLMSKRTSLQQILSAPECEFWSSLPREQEHRASASPQTRSSPSSRSDRIIEFNTRELYGMEITRFCALGTEKEVSSSNRDEAGNGATAGHQGWRHEEVMHNTGQSVRENVNAHGPSTSVNLQGDYCILEFQRETKNSFTGTTESGKIDSLSESPLHSMLDSLSENEVSTYTTDDFSSSSSSVPQISYGHMHQKDYQSPVSVLEPFLAENVVTSPGILHVKGELQSTRVLFEDECSSEPLPRNRPQTKTQCIEEHDHISQYVHILLQASGLHWNALSEIESPAKELLDDSAFEKIMPDHCCFNTRLLFDHINEVLMDMRQSLVKSTRKLAVVKPNMIRTPLDIAVMDQIMTGYFYFLPQKNRKTLDQLVSEDVKRCSSWLDIQMDMEIVVNDISESLLKDSVLDMLLEFLE